MANAQWFSLTEKEIDVLFGKEGNNTGLLIFNNAELPAYEQSVLGDDQALRQRLFTTRSMTKINATTGTADAGSLRSIEVAVPINLASTIEVNTAGDNPLGEQVQQWLSAAASFITSVGAMRQNGFGSCSVTVTGGAWLCVNIT